MHRVAMTPDKLSRLRELPKLIADENPDKMKILATELRRLLDEEAAEQDVGRSRNQRAIVRDSGESTLNRVTSVVSQ